MDESSIEVTTLWGLLIRPAIGLHLARFALFILIALPIEIFCDLKSRCFACSFTTIFLQLLIGVSVTVASYFFYTTFYLPGERMTPPAWYYPMTFTVVLFAIIIFSIGLWSELRRGQRFTSVLRGVTFSLTVFFAITAIMTPFELNRAIEKRETEKQN